MNSAATLPVGATYPGTSTVHYVVTLKGDDARVSVWGVEAFRALQKARRIVKVHAITPR